MAGIEPTVVDELDRLRYGLLNERVKRIQAEMGTIRLQLSQLNQELQAAVGDLKKVTLELSDKYGMSEGDSFSVVTGVIARK